MSDVIDLRKAFKSGFHRFASDAVKQGLQEVTGLKQGRGRPKQYYRIPVAVAHALGQADLFEQMEKGYIPDALAPKQFGLPVASSRSTVFDRVLDFLQSPVGIAIVLLTWWYLVRGKGRKEDVSGAYACVKTESGKVVCGERV